MLQPCKEFQIETIQVFINQFSKTMNRLIGLSLSFCIKDMILGNKPEGQTLAIISGTDFKPKDGKTWQQVAYDHYSKTIWKDLDEDDCMFYLNSYPIVQPRAFGLEPPNISDGYWININQGQFHNKTTINFMSKF